MDRRKELIALIEEYDETGDIDLLISEIGKLYEPQSEIGVRSKSSIFAQKLTDQILTKTVLIKDKQKGGKHHGKE